MGAKLGKSNVEHVARLARLPVSSNELQKYGGQLGKIVEYVGAIGKLKTQNSKLKTTTKQSLTSLKNLKTLREDKTNGKCLTQEEATGNAKNVHNGLFMIGAIFEE